MAAAAAVAAVMENNAYLRAETGVGVGESEIKRGASGCQADQNKHRVSCRQRADFSQTDTELDLLSSSQRQHQQNTGCVNVARACFVCCQPSLDPT